MSSNENKKADDLKKLISFIAFKINTENTILKRPEQFTGSESDIITNSLLIPIVDRLKLLIHEEWFFDEEETPNHMEIISWICFELLSKNESWHDLSGKGIQLLIVACQYCTEVEKWSADDSDGWKDAVPWHWK